ncbi:hypothetical protein [Anaerosinus massiliensis]|uniref:hypothetical protein n=1 Tax=Massilibacillus massiliensis TaxID=1806837 RepID=UPI000DA60643|nr:hypothetical protein [Massilibacillus massiliensis]
MKKVSVAYQYLWNTTIVLTMSVLVFYFDPVWNAYQITHTGKDGGILSILVVVSIVTMIAMCISLRNYWKWVAGATFCVTFSSFLNVYSRQYENIDRIVPYTYQTYIWESTANGFVYVVFTLPVAAWVLFSRKRKNNENY